MDILTRATELATIAGLTSEAAIAAAQKEYDDLQAQRIAELNRGLVVLKQAMRDKSKVDTSKLLQTEYEQGTGKVKSEKQLQTAVMRLTDDELLDIKTALAAAKDGTAFDIALDEIAEYIDVTRDFKNPSSIDDASLKDLTNEFFSDLTLFWCAQNYYRINERGVIQDWGAEDSHNYARGKEIETNLGFTKIDAAVAYIERIAYAYRPDQINPETRVPLANGVYDLRDASFVPRTTSQLFTYNINYEYTAGAKLTKEIKLLLLKIFGGDKDELKHFLSALGVWLSTFIADKSINLLVGTNPKDNSNNGKSSLLELLGKIVGETYFANETLARLSGNSFAASRLSGKILNLADETDESFSNAERLKSLTGQKWFTSERKGKDAVKDRMLTSLVFCVQDLDSLQIGKIADKQAILDRLNIFSLPSHFSRTTADDDWENLEFKIDVKAFTDTISNRDNLNSLVSVALDTAAIQWSTGAFKRYESAAMKRLVTDYSETHYKSTFAQFCEVTDYFKNGMTGTPLDLKISGDPYTFETVYHLYSEWCKVFGGCKPATRDTLKRQEKHITRDGYRLCVSGSKYYWSANVTPGRKNYQ